MIIGVPKEIKNGENRVALSPDAVKRLIKLRLEVVVETGAGDRAHFTDAEFQAAGARIVADARTLWREADLVVKVQPPALHPELKLHEADLLREGGHLAGFIWPARNKELLDRLAARRATVLAMDCVPRISRAQKMDALSSMANIAGYRAVIEAANQFGSFFTGQITAAGKVPPAKVLVIGAGVAGLSAIGTARGLGAVVRAFDTRPEVKEQVESMGADFLTIEIQEDGAGEGGYAKVMSEAFIKAEMELFARLAREVDIIITTALVPGRKAPQLITAEMVRSMKEGSVIVDLAAEQGGNCELTVADQLVTHGGVTIVGYADLPSRLPTQASVLYGNNLVNLLTDMVKQGVYTVDLSDEVVRGALVLNGGELTWPPPKPKPTAPQAPAPSPAPAGKIVPATPAVPEKQALKKATAGSGLIVLAVAALALLGLGEVAPPDFLGHLTVFVLACFVGWQLVWNVSPALHTPLMSVTNAISGIIVIGAMLGVSGPLGHVETILAAVAILVATINVTGGFFVTQRMLNMFRK